MSESSLVSNSFSRESCLSSLSSLTRTQPNRTQPTAVCDLKPAVLDKMPSSPCPLSDLWRYRADALSQRRLYQEEEIYQEPLQPSLRQCKTRKKERKIKITVNEEHDIYVKQKHLNTSLIIDDRLNVNCLLNKQEYITTVEIST